MKSVTYAILIDCISLWASNFIIGTRLVDYWSEIAVSFFRITCIILFLGIVGWRAIKKARPSRKQWYVLTIAGILGVSINHFTCLKV